MGSATPPKLLVVDDDSAVCDQVRLALFGTFLIADEVSGGRAIASAVKEKPDLILLELDMQNVNGFEILEQLGQNPITSSIPVVCMSAGTGDVNRTRAHELGAIGYVHKPINTETFSKDLRALFDLTNIVMESPSRGRRFVISFNQGAKYKLMRQYLLEHDATSKCLILSLREGSEVCNAAMEEMIARERLIFLQIAPSLVTKFPYLEDLSPVLKDLTEFLKGDSGQYTLFFDDPKLLLNPKDSKNAIARLHLLKEGLLKPFRQTTLFCSRERSPELRALINEMATVFCQ